MPKLTRRSAEWIGIVLLLNAWVSDACTRQAVAAESVASTAGHEGAAERTRSWVERSFARPTGPVQAVQGLSILQANHLVVQNQSVWQTPLQLGDKTYTHGLCMDAPARVRVLLPDAGEELLADIGIDNNQNTRSNPEVGSARFCVVVSDRRVYESPILKLADGATAVKVPLGGAREFFLEVDDAGDGVGWDQCDWADAVVRLASGERLSLGEMPFISGKESRRLAVPFSFKYGGKPSDDFLDRWEFTSRNETAGDTSLQVNIYKDPASGLSIECQVKTYADFPVVDWVFWLTNTGTEETPIIEDFLPLDVVDILTKDEAGPITLRWSNGDTTAKDSFLPHDEPLQVGERRAFRSSLSSSEILPFFNLQGSGGGCVLAVGWTGAWKAEFCKETPGAVAVSAGMQRTHFRLKPGERVRAPSMVLLRWQGERMIDGHNLFRRLMLAHYVQRLNGNPAEPPVAHNSAATVYVNNMRMPTEESELALIEWIAGLGCEAYWMDAYWYPQPWHANLGNWYPRPEDFPNGLRPLADAAHERDLRFVLWMLPPAVSAGTKWADQYAEYLHGGDRGRGGLWKMGDPKAREALTQRITELLDAWAVDIYREDGSGLPPEEGSEDRQGIAEMKHIEGLYHFWTDVVARSHAQLMDNCCGGGNRIDVETSRLSFCLWRSDFNDIGEGLKGEAHWPRMGLADQVMVGGLSLYVPFHTGPVWDMHPYNFRGAMTSGICLYGDVNRQGFPDGLCRKAIRELKELRPLYQGDLYPLLPLTTDQKDWYAYQLDRPDLGQGCVLVFRRSESPYTTVEVRLSAIDPGAAYEASLTGETYDQAPWVKTGGQELMQSTVLIDEKPGSALLRYRRIPSSPPR